MLNSGLFISGVSSSGIITPGTSFRIAWRVTNNDQISSTVALIGLGGLNSESWVGGDLVSGNSQDGTYYGTLKVPANLAEGRYLICAIAISSTNERSASQCGGLAEYVKVAEIIVSSATPVDSQNPVVVVGSGVLTTSKNMPAPLVETVNKVLRSISGENSVPLWNKTLPIGGKERT